MSLWRQRVYFLITWRRQVITGIVFQQPFWLIRTVFWPEKRKRSRCKKNLPNTEHASNFSASSCQPYLGKVLPGFLRECYEMKFHWDSAVSLVFFKKFKSVRRWPLSSPCLSLSLILLRTMGQSAVFQTDFDKWTNSDLCCRKDIIMSNSYNYNISS